MSFCSCHCCDHGRVRDSSCLWLTPEEKEQLASRLDQRPDQSVIAYKPGKGGNQAYLPGNIVFEIANSLFGFNGWSSSVLKVDNDYCAEKNGRWYVGITAYVRISLKDGTFHEEVGYGCADNMPNRSEAVKKCLKEAVTDAKKRALRLFGNAVGLCIADKEFVSAVKRGRGEEYQGAVETAIKKQKQQQANNSSSLLLDAKPPSTVPMNHGDGTSGTHGAHFGKENTSVRTPRSELSTNSLLPLDMKPQSTVPMAHGDNTSGPHGAHFGKENTSVRTPRNELSTNSLNPMPVGPTVNRTPNQLGPGQNQPNSIQHSTVHSYHGSNPQVVIRNQQKNQSGAVHNQQSSNQQQTVLQNHNHPGRIQPNTVQGNRNINQQGAQQNQSNCHQHGYNDFFY